MKNAFQQLRVKPWGENENECKNELKYFHVKVVAFRQQRPGKRFCGFFLFANANGLSGPGRKNSTMSDRLFNKENATQG